MRVVAFVRFALCSVALVAAEACSGPFQPTPVPGAPALTCPIDVVRELADVVSADVSYPAPVVAGGAEPVLVSCLPSSGTRFPIGETTVTCTATDRLRQQAQCTFKVRLELIPRLRGTKVLAFGDSITFGEVSPPASLGIRFFDPVNNYPALLSGLLNARYKLQSIRVINEGWGGEEIVSVGETRLGTLVRRERPDVLIVLEGVNDLNGGTDPRLVSDALRRGVSDAVREGVPLVIVSTILPGVAGRTKPPDPAKVDALNAQIRSWAAAERAVLADTYAAVAPKKEQLIGVDGLHPTPDGYRVLAETYLAVIRANFEVARPAGFSGVEPSWPPARTGR